MEAIATQVKDVTMLKRLMFATDYLPKDIPSYWEVIARFGCSGGDVTLSPESARVAMETVQFFDENAFFKEIELMRELIEMEYATGSKADKLPTL